MIIAPSMLKDIVESLSENPYFGAGAGLAGLGVVLAIFKRSTVIGNAYFRRRFIISLEINNEDPAYPWLLSYIDRYSRQQTRHLTVHTRIRQAESGKTNTNFHFLPGHGRHFFAYNGRFVVLERQREKQTIQLRDGLRTPFETVILKTIGTNPQFFKRMLSKATDEALSRVETDLIIYHAVGPDWRRFGSPRRKRPLVSIVLDRGFAESLVSDLSEFVNSSQWYADRGVPYRRGYLFHGPPGCGKSSFIASLAGEFGYSVCTVSLSDRTLDDDRLNHLLNTAPPSSIVLLEDVDAAFGVRSSDDPPAFKIIYDGMSRVTFSGLLNAIDGVACAEERVLFMTTNHLDRLDPALIRPGRVDVRRLFGYCTDYMLIRMFVRFYDDHPDVDMDFARRFSTAVRQLKVSVSPAQIQGHLLLFKTDPVGAIRDVTELRS